MTEIDGLQLRLHVPPPDVCAAEDQGAETVRIAHAAAAAEAQDRILVVFEMSGGNDGLNTVVPYADDRYYRLRPNIGIRPDKLRKLDDEEKAEERRLQAEKLKKEERDRRLSKMNAEEQKKFLQKEKEAEQRKMSKKRTTRG